MFHLQYNIQDWDQAVVPGKHQVFVAVDRGDMLKTAKEINPQAVTVLRHHDDGIQVFSPTWEGSVEIARHWWSTFVDQTFREQYAPYTDFVKGYNEVLANSQNDEERRQRILMEQALAYTWNTEYRNQSDYNHIRPVLASAAIGNDIPWQIAEISVNEDCLLSYHAYTRWVNKEREADEWRWYSGRWATMDNDYAMNYGIKPTWIFTECGPYEGAETGWRSPECLNRDVDLYIQAMSEWIADVKNTVAYNENRVIGFATYTVNYGDKDQFKSYHTQQPELNKLRDLYVNLWTKSTPPIVTPPLSTMRVTAFPWLNLRSLPTIDAENVGRLSYSSEFRRIGTFLEGDNVWAQMSQDPLIYAAEVYNGKRYLKEIE